jgi:DNA gyrase/topoisomerase IV subunit B
MKGSVTMAEVPKKQKKIQVIDDPVEAVRKLPDVYIGALGNAGYVNMYREIVQNSLDEIIKGNTLDKNIIVSFDERTHTCIVEDNGQGIELDMLVPVFSVLHSSSNYDKKEGSGEYSSGKNGMGATITNYLSKFFIVESYRPDGKAGKVEFNEGKINSKGLQKLKPRKAKHGLITTFTPSDMMGNITVTVAEIQNLTWLITHLCSVGTCITFNAIDNMGRVSKTIIKNNNGIMELIDSICTKKVINPVYFSEDNGTMKVEVLFSYDVTNMDDPKILGFANMCPTKEGTHIDGFLDGIVKYFRDYMNKIYLANNKKLQVNAQDIRTGLRAVISVFHVKPMFTG